MSSSEAVAVAVLVEETDFRRACGCGLVLEASFEAARRLKPPILEDFARVVGGGSSSSVSSSSVVLGCARFLDGDSLDFRPGGVGWR
jgi:hypothetical protein